MIYVSEKTRKKHKPLLPDTLVRVRSLPEILSTLDRDGMLDALPFMPEMAGYCGRRFRVTKRLERACEESKRGMRRIRNVVFLDKLRCDGSHHGGCQKRCRLFWKEAWLTTQDNEEDLPGGVTDSRTQMAALTTVRGDGQYVCQATELVRATTPLAPIDLMSYVRDIRSKTYTIPELAQGLFYAVFLRFRYYLTGTPYRYFQGEQVQTPSESLNLQPGEWVQVKTREEIRATLDVNGMNRGLHFRLDLLPYCGGTYRVLDRVDRMVYEPTGKIIHLKDTVILEDCTCKGCHSIKGGCPRDNFNFWREIWLRRVPRA